MADEKTLLELFFSNVERGIGEEGIYPHPGLCLNYDGEIEMAALAFGPDECISWFWDSIANKGAVECVFGIDRTTRDGQGTEFRDVLTCAYWKEGLDGKSWGSSFRIGVINYQFAPELIVRPFDWGNEFWNERMQGEVASRVPPARIVIKSAATEGSESIAATDT